MALADGIILRHFLDDLSETDLEPRWCVADAPKRAKLQGFVSHSGTYSCQYCFASKSHGKFPASSRHGEPRTMAAVSEIINFVQSEANGDFDAVPESRLRGVRGISPLSSLPNFDVITQVPTERMHLLDLGIVRKMVGLTYKVPGKKVYEKAQRVPLANLNAILEEVKLVSDFSRRSRALDIGTWKAEEYRNLTMALFPAILTTCSRDCRKIWLQTVYLYRALMLPNDLFDYQERRDELEEMVQKWYVLYEATFHEENCVFNVHTFSHILQVRDLGPLTATSAVRFEDQYQHLKNAYTAGTVSTGLQALKNLYVAIGSRHSCKKRVEFQGRKTSRVNDRLVYLRGGDIIEVTDINDDLIEGTTVPLDNGLHLIPGCDFNAVLCFKRSRHKGEGKKVATTLHYVRGKVIECCDILSVIPLNVLLE